MQNNKVNWHRSDSNKIKKIKRLDWDDYFLKIALLVAERSTCRRHNVGAVVVKNRYILATGYNGAPAGLNDCLKIDCLRDQLKIESGTKHEVCRAVHAEQNAIIQCGLHNVSPESATVYCTHSPCLICAKILANAKIKRYITFNEYQDKEFLRLFKHSGIKFIKKEKPKTKIETKP